ncbi:MAG: hypothetical protein ACLR4Z_14050 [Butyricicoccaceae bacterium]
MNIKRATALALSLSLLLGAAACGKSGSEAADTGSKTSAQLLEEENAILGAHQELWDQVFASMDKSSPATSKNYGDVLLSAVENCKGQALQSEGLSDAEKRCREHPLDRRAESRPCPLTRQRRPERNGRGQCVSGVYRQGSRRECGRQQPVREQRLHGRELLVQRLQALCR